MSDGAVHGCLPTGLSLMMDMKSRMKREFHVRFCEKLGGAGASSAYSTPPGFDKLKEVTRDTYSTDLVYYWYDVSENELHNFPYTKNDSQTDLSTGKNIFPKNYPKKLPKLTVVLSKNKDSLVCNNHKKIVRKYGLKVYSKPISALSKECHATSKDATAFIKDQLDSVILQPEDAITGEFNCVRINAKGKVQGIKKTISKTFTWKNKINGIELLGDIISIAFTNQQMIKYRYCWHNICEKKPEVPLDIISPQKLWEKAKESHKLKKDHLPFNVKQFYYGFHDLGDNKEFIPVWAFYYLKGTKYCGMIFYNAHTGEEIDLEHDIEKALKVVVGDNK